MSVANVSPRRSKILEHDSEVAAERPMKKVKHAKIIKTFVCDANRCVMSFLPQPMKELASDECHSTVWPDDLKICKLCIAHKSAIESNSCNGEGCTRIDVFGDGACMELKFVQQTDGKMYCPSCIEDVIEQEDISDSDDMNSEIFK